MCVFHRIVSQQHAHYWNSVTVGCRNNAWMWDKITVSHDGAFGMGISLSFHPYEMSMLETRFEILQSHHAPWVPNFMSQNTIRNQNSTRRVFSTLLNSFYFISDDWWYNSECQKVRFSRVEWNSSPCTRNSI